MTFPSRLAIALSAALLIATVPVTTAQPTFPAAATATASIVTARGVIDVDGGLIQIAASRDGIVQDVLVEEGSRVQRGQILARLDNRSASAQQAIAEAELSQSRAALLPIEVRILAARRELARLDPLVSRNAEPRQKLDEQRDALKLAEAELAQARTAIQLAEARLQAVLAEIDQRIVRAPLDGVIVRRLSRPGDGVSTLNVTPMFWLAPATPPLVRTELTEQAIERIRPGQSVDIALEPEESLHMTGRVERVGLAFAPRRVTVYDPRERNDLRVVEVVIALQNLDTLPYPPLLGQRVIVRITTEP